jgi:hypothetical protein
MVFFYRMGQSQRLLGTFLWSVTLALLAFQYVQPFFVEIGLTRQDQVFSGLVILWVVTLLALLLLGILFDRVFKLWKEDAAIGVARNPYSVKDMYPKELVAFRDLWLPFFRAYVRDHPDPDIQQALDNLERWVSQGRIE